jgi:hypothetical protein
VLASFDIQKLVVGGGSNWRAASDGHDRPVRRSSEAEPIRRVIRKKEADGEHPASDYLVVEDPGRPETWHLRVRDTDGKLDHRLMGAAWAALHGGYRGRQYQGPHRLQAIAVLTRLYESEGMKVPGGREHEEASARLSAAGRGGERERATGPRRRPAGALPGAAKRRRGPQFVAALAEPAANGLVRIPLAVTGTWVRGAEKFSITRQDLESIARNFERRKNGEINVDYDHASEMPEVAAGGPIPSAGRIVGIEGPEELREPGAKANFKLPIPDLRGGMPEVAGATGAAASRAPAAGRRATGPRLILWGWYEPTERARALVGRREYRYISPAIDWGAKSKRTGQPQGATLTSVALTNRPFLEELPQIHLSDPAYRLIDVGDVHVDASLPNVSIAAGAPHAQGRPQVADSESNKGGEEPPEQPGGVMKKVDVSAVDGKVALSHPDFTEEYYAEPEELRGILEEMGLPPDSDAEAPSEIPLEQAAAALSEAEARGKMVPAVEVFHARVEQALEEAVKAGKILPRQRAEWRRVGLADFATFSKLLNEQPARVPLRPMGFSGTGPVDAGTQVKFLAEQRVRERGISYGQALSELGREQPDLIQKYRRAVSGE